MTNFAQSINLRVQSGILCLQLYHPLQQHISPGIATDGGRIDRMGYVCSKYCTLFI